MKAISYSLFGYERERAESCFDFNSYLRGLMLCLRFNRLIYPEWKTVLQTDWATYNGFEPLFKSLEDKNILIVDKHANGAKLCQAMLWRMNPIYDNYSHVIFRDLDSLSTYRERQAVDYWIAKETKALHAITDSISHDLPLLGGMIGARCDHFKTRTNTNQFKELMSLCNIDLSIKGSDQIFLNQSLYPMFAEKGRDSITQHYILGYGQTWLSDWHNKIDDIDIGIDPELKESNSVCGHIGAAGWYEPPTMRFINKHKDKFIDLKVIESLYPKIFYWNE